MNISIGVMQGRLSPPTDGKIQAFPWNTWKQEFWLAKDLGLDTIEWTIDADGFYDNPLCTTAGREEIRDVASKTGVQIHSLTADVVMHEPFYKLDGSAETEALQKFRHLVQCCISLGIKYLVVPCVDAGRIETSKHTEKLLEEMCCLRSDLSKSPLKIVFESDLGPSDLSEWIRDFDRQYFGINYDMGNSASLGYDPTQEWEAYADRIWNIHVKDRVLNGPTVPLEAGSANFDAIFSAIRRHRYQGMYIFQVARGPSGHESGTVSQHISWLKKRLSK